MNCYIDQQERQYLADIDSAERNAEADEAVLADMMGNRTQVDDFLAYTGSDVATLLSLLMSRGLPSYGRLDVTQSDDEYYEMLDGQIDRLRTEFESYARTPIQRESPMACWERNRQEDRL